MPTQQHPNENARPASNNVRNTRQAENENNSGPSHRNTATGQPRKRNNTRQLQPLQTKSNVTNSPRPKRRNLTLEASQGIIRIGGSVGDYRIKEKLGEGENGFCYVAELKDKSAIVALKFQDKKENGAMIENELRFLKKVQGNDAMMKYIENFTYGSYNVIVTNLLHCDLKSQLAYNRKLSSHNTLRIGYELFTALDWLRKKGVVHRDLHSGNVFFDKKFSKAVIGDFGCSEMEKRNELGLKFHDLNHISHRVNDEEEHGFLDDAISILFLMLELCGSRSLFQDGNIEKMVKKKKKLFKKPADALIKETNKFMIPIVFELRRQFNEPRPTHTKLLTVIVKQTVPGFDPKKKYETNTSPPLHLV
ncbi:hypothetical protein GCK72_023048 [Caenorhabditis remanei]|uniref:Protein kinase domain-containing protein n=1 Tax=Caenorhabditis remanei TaxID=31234 RepID=A0A6A5FVX8_CAERE|nr:hypothetical protein GCK72_023048 [Caenorhabditis remanei]KAF1746591.1 hypothetical protein GCK72_023048 [Caenorhabditis remanei]